jgi:hypothetical protein
LPVNSDQDGSPHAGADPSVQVPDGEPREGASQ